MKALILTAAILGLSNPLSALGPEKARRPFIAGHIGVYGGNDILESSVMGGASYGYDFRYWGCAFSILHYNKENSIGGNGKGTTSLTPLMLNGYGRLAMNEMFTLKLAAGLSYMFATHTLDGRIVNFYDALGLEAKEKIKDGLAYQLGTGLEINVTENIKIGADLYYMFFETRAEFSATDIWNKKFYQNEMDITLDSIIGILSAKYQF